jgi:hypothetical protein
MRWVVALAGVAGLAGCVDYGPVEKELQDVHAQLSQVSTDVEAMRTSLDSATEETRQAARKAAAATSIANQALTMAQWDQDKLAQLDEKLDQLDRAKKKPRKAATTQETPEPPAGPGTPPK